VVGTARRRVRQAPSAPRPRLTQPPGAAIPPTKTAAPRPRAPACPQTRRDPPGRPQTAPRDHANSRSDAIRTPASPAGPRQTRPGAWPHPLKRLLHATRSNAYCTIEAGSST